MADPGQFNADQLAFWNGPGGRTWVERQDVAEPKRAYRFFISTASSEKRPAAQINRNKAPPIIARFL
jgi:hypothetical protein